MDDKNITNPLNRTDAHQVLGIRHLTDSTFVLKLERKKFKFTPGQCVNIGLVDEAVNREYSTYSGIDDPYLEFLIKEVEDGLVSPELKKLKIGDQVSLDGAYGLFTLRNPEERGVKHLFVGSGTGIAPFHAYAKSYPKLDYKIIHGIRQVNEQYDRDDYAEGRYVSCVSREEGGDFHGRVTEYLKSHPVNHSTMCYLCGNKEMINDVYDILRQQGVGGDNIITEVFF